MYKVILADDTIYYVATEERKTAIRVIEHKLRDRFDFRLIAGAEEVYDESSLGKNIFINSDDEYDGKELKCAYGYSYRFKDVSEELLIDEKERNRRINYVIEYVIKQQNLKF